MKNVLVFLIVCIGTNVFSQNLKGTITNQQNEPLPGATVQLLPGLNGTISNANGVFEFKNLKPGSYTIKISFLGFNTLTQTVEILNQNTEVNFKLIPKPFEAGEFIVYGTRAQKNNPISQTIIDKETIEKLNLGQDITFLLDQNPSVLISSDAGAGIGYTDMRIRGTDVTRINVTINGIPLNDPESQGVFWVNTPDFSSSLNSVQIQRGVGTSTNGGGSFGGTINMETEQNEADPFAETNFSVGSYQTLKSNIKFGSGTLKNNWNFQGRLSSIQSNGYIDRATSNLKSYFLSAKYQGKGYQIKLIHFSGNENTYQAWYGTPEAVFKNKGNEAKLDYALSEGLTPAQTQNLLNSDRRYNHYLYENEVDNYTQNHYQMHITGNITEYITGQLSLHFTKGFGYFEQYRNDEDFSDYGLTNPIIGTDTIQSTNLIRQRWLNNNFYGLVGHVNYRKKKLNITIGGAANQYFGKHFGDIIWAQHHVNFEKNYRYYTGNGIKNDWNVYGKTSYYLSNNFEFFTDLQLRQVGYKTKGTDNDLKPYDVNQNYLFFNPKVGLNYNNKTIGRWYVLFAVANREPNRSDFLDAALIAPKPETLFDYELGWEKTYTKTSFAATAYYMDYKNQLVATGELNDAGAIVKTNVPKSYRAGIEIMAKYKPAKWIEVSGNYTYSSNKIQQFNEIIYDYTTGYDILVIPHNNTDIALSPNHIGKSNVTLYPVKNGSISLLSSFVSKQYLDNTSNQNRVIDGFTVSNLRLSYLLNTKRIKDIELTFLINNIFNELYASRGYTYSYIYGQLITQNHYYPQAERNYLMGLRLRF